MSERSTDGWSVSFRATASRICVFIWQNLEHSDVTHFETFWLRRYIAQEGLVQTARSEKSRINKVWTAGHQLEGRVFRRTWWQLARTPLLTLERHPFPSTSDSQPDPSLQSSHDLCPIVSTYCTMNQRRTS